MVSYTRYTTRKLSYIVDKCRSSKCSEYLRASQEYNVVPPSLTSVRRLIQRTRETKSDLTVAEARREA